MSTSSLRERVTALRAEISKSSAARDAAIAAPVDAAIAARRLDGEIAAAKARFAGFSYLASPGGGFSAASFNTAAAADMFGFLAHFDADGLKETALGAIPPGGLSDRDRADRVASASAALLAAEIEEEMVLRQIDPQIGGHEPRRPDSRPDILLAPLSELESAIGSKKGGFFRRAS